MDNNGVNNSTNQTIPGVVVAPPVQNNQVQNTVNQPVVVNGQTTGPTTVASAIPNSIVEPVSQMTKIPQPLDGQVMPPLQEPVTNVVNETNQTTTNTGESDNTAEKKKKIKKEKQPMNKATKVCLLIIILLIFVCGFLCFYHQQEVTRMRVECTPVSTTKDSKELDLNSTIVQDLYNKVATTIREDLGQSELNDELKLYLAFRQIANSDLYESHCNLYKTDEMEPFVCELTASFVPKAFKAETIQLEVKKLFGESVSIPNQSIQLGKSCIGGFQYIEERGEYVQGQCQSAGAPMYSVEKKLISATSNQSTIVLREEVKYYGSEGLEVPERLVSGVYEYTFKLDMNYNYVFISKVFVE